MDELAFRLLVLGKQQEALVVIRASIRLGPPSPQMRALEESRRSHAARWFKSVVAHRRSRRRGVTISSSTDGDTADS